MRNKFDTLQEIFERHTSNDEYEILNAAHIKAAAGYIPNNSKAKCRVPCESIVVMEKRDDMKKHPYSIKEMQQIPMYGDLRTSKN